MFIGEGLYEFWWTWKGDSGDVHYLTDKIKLDKPSDMNYHYNRLHDEYRSSNAFRLVIRYLERIKA